MIDVIVLLLVGVVLGIGGLLVWVRIDGAAASRARARNRARLEQQRSEARIQQITQDAVQQMLNLARRSQ